MNILSMRIKSRRTAALLGIVTAASLLGGCGNAIPAMSDEDTADVTQYAADVLLSTKEGNTRLVDTEEEGKRRAEVDRKAREVQAKIEAQRQAQKQAKEDAEKALEDTPTTDASGSSSSASESFSSIEDLASFLGLDGFSTSYGGYEITTSYTDSSIDDTDWAPVIEATSGYNLIVIKINVTNTTSEDKVCDVLSTGATFRIVVDGEHGGASLMTLLLSDFSIAQDTIAAGEQKEYVLATQIPGDVSSAESIRLTAAKDGEKIRINLQ